jgi:hypothetical protein
MVERGAPLKDTKTSASGRVEEMDMGHVLLIVMERGGAWPGRVAESEDVVVVHDDREVLLQRTLQPRPPSPSGSGTATPRTEPRYGRGGAASGRSHESTMSGNPS